MKVLGPILTFLFAWIDSIVAKMITLVYNLLMNLSNLVLYSDSIVKTLGQRIGIILGIFMLFRLAVSLINYMISPEKFSDNKTGGAQLVKNIIISLVLLATINTIFETAYMVQKRIVESGIVQKIFFGDNSETDGVDIGYYLYTGLFTPNEDVIPECKTMWDITEPISQECDDKLFELTETNARNSIYEARNDLDMSKVFSNYDVVTANRDGAFTGTELFNYTPIVSTAVGVMALLILVSFSMELAIRAVKLLFLQIVAPVPIIANMDTGKGKDIFNKWLKQCINTYISVFIRLIAINFGVFMIVLVKGNFKDIFTGNILLNIFVIIGCLMFAKQVPKLIEDMFGIKLDGMSLRPLKKFQENALFGKQITGIASGAIAGTASGLRAAGANAIVSPGAGGRILGAGAGFASAFSKGLVGGFKGEKFGKNFTSSYNIAMENKERRLSRKDDDVGFWEMEHNKLQRSVHQKTRGQRADELDKALESYKKNGEAIKNAIFANDKASFRFVDSRGQSHDFAGAKGLKEFIDNMQGPTQAPGESPESFAQRQEEFIKYKNEFKDELDRQVSQITTGVRTINDNNNGNSGGAAAQASVKKMLESMDEQRESINKEGNALYGEDFNEIASATAASGNNMSMKNSLGAATGAQTTISSHAGHDRDVDKYGAKKDGK